MEPPIQTEYFLSGGAMILIFMVEGARAVISFCMRSAMPGYGGASGENGVGVEVLSDVNVALHDGVVGGFVDAARLHAQEGGLEQGLGAAEAVVSDGDHLAVGEFVGLFERGGGGGGGHFLLEVKSHEAELLLDVAHDLPLGIRREGVRPAKTN